MRPVPEWFRDAKFGVIIHWGLYSIPGWAPLDDELVRILETGASAPDGDAASDPLARNSYAEWYQNSALLDGPTRTYHEKTHGGRDYGDFREPFAEAVRGWRPESWASLFAAAGAKYVVPVTKHHDGFLLWPSTVDNPHQDGLARRPRRDRRTRATPSGRTGCVTASTTPAAPTGRSTTCRSGASSTWARASPTARIPELRRRALARAHRPLPAEHPVERHLATHPLPTRPG